MKTSELTGAALDWAVAECEGETVTWEGKGTHAFLTTSEIRVLADWDTAQEYSPSTDWAQGGPIIEREEISTCWEGTTWVATLFNRNCGETWYGHHYGPTPLIAAMRCYVASKLGDEVEIPEGLL